MNWDEFQDAWGAAKRILRQADSIADNMAAMLCDRLQLLNHHNLCSLKRELARYNMRTREWK